VSGSPLSGDQVRVQVEAAACAEPELAALESPDRAIAPGGACVGHVVDAGEGAAHLRGRRVLVGPLDPCGECERCRRGLPFACADGSVLGASAPGALSGHVVVRGRWATEMAGDLDVAGPLAALIAREAADAYALYARSGLAAGEPAVVLGTGPVARLLVDIASARGARVVAASAGEPGGAERARAHLAEHGGRPAKILAAPVGDELGLALRLAGPGTLVAALARTPALGGDTTAVAALLAGGGALVGVPAAHPDLLPEVAALAVKGEIDLAAAADVQPAGSAVDDASRAAATRAALAGGRALVLAFTP
jgi:D-arabinose 1-dehydrogenase-like Zn-dependent alcohol dehydrogenase